MFLTMKYTALRISLLRMLTTADVAQVQWFIAACCPHAAQVRPMSTVPSALEQQMLSDVMRVCVVHCSNPFVLSSKDRYCEGASAPQSIAGTRQEGIPLGHKRCLDQP